MYQFVIGQNIGLATGRSNKSEDCDHFYVTNMMMEAKCAERTTQSALFPLYSYTEIGGKTVNYNKTIVKVFSEKIGIPYIEGEHESRDSFSEYDLFCYIYAVLSSRSYRDKYGEFLKADFPKVPFVEDSSLFWRLVELGSQLVKYHTMQDISSDLIVFCGTDYCVEKIKYSKGKIFINKSSYFEKISEEEWGFSIGGYNPLQRRFKD